MIIDAVRKCCAVKLVVGTGVSGAAVFKLLDRAGTNAENIVVVLTIAVRTVIDPDLVAFDHRVNSVA